MGDATSGSTVLAGGRWGRPSSVRKPLVVLPTHEEEQNIVGTLESLRHAVPHADVLVVDDAGGDRTADLAEETGARVGRVRVMRRDAKAGLGSAYRQGFAIALRQDYDAVVEMDADGSHDPWALPALLAGLSGADLVIGSRYVPGGVIPQWSAHRRLLSRGGNRLASLALASGVSDLTSGFRAYRAAALRAADVPTVRSEGYGFQIEMAARVLGTGGRVVEVPITFRDRTRGSSKLSGRIVAEALLLCVTLAWRSRVRTWAPRRLRRGRTGAERSVTAGEAGAPRRDSAA